MKRVTMNIGMGNNPYETRLNDFANFFRVRFGAMWRYSIGNWEGANENTLVVHFETDEDVVDYTERLCDWTTQTAIAVKVDGDGVLVYNNHTNSPCNPPHPHPCRNEPPMCSR